MTTRPASRSGRRQSIRTIIVQISRKLKATYRVRSGRLFSRLLAALLGVYSSFVMAQVPTGMNVQSGQATSSVNGNAMTVNQATNKAIIDWQTFSIGANNSVQFVQPSSSSVALNRVVGNDVSNIFGSPFSDLGSLAVEHVDFDEIGVEAFALAPLSVVGTMAL